MDWLQRYQHSWSRNRCTHARLGAEDSRVSHESGWSGALDELVRHFSTEHID